MRAAIDKMGGCECYRVHVIVCVLSCVCYGVNVYFLTREHKIYTYTLDCRHAKISASLHTQREKGRERKRERERERVTLRRVLTCTH